MNNHQFGIFFEFKQRRARLYEDMGNDSIAVVVAARECIRAGNSKYSYRQSSDFYYLTGFPEPEAIAIFIPGRKEGEYILFNRLNDPLQERWTGKRIGQQEACSIYGVDQVFPLTAVETIMPELLLGKSHIYYDFGCDSIFDARLISWINYARRKARSGMNSLDDISYLSKIVHEMRLRHSDYEITLMRQSANIAVNGHLRAMKACRPGMFEYELEAELCYEYIRHGGHVPAFLPIVASGTNVCTLHYEANNACMQDGDLALIDAGVECNFYASDITRTIPIGKHFNCEQRAIYQAVLDTQLTVIEKIRPGVKWDELQQTSERVITEKLLALDLLKGELEELIAKEAYKHFYMHRIGHWLGIDTHDVGKYAINGSWRVLEPNMVLTIEPGIYITANNAEVEKKWWNIGVRIEDEVLVTENGCEVLTAALPKTIAEIEALRSLA